MRACLRWGQPIAGAKRIPGAEKRAVAERHHGPQLPVPAVAPGLRRRTRWWPWTRPGRESFASEPLAVGAGRAGQQVQLETVAPKATLPYKGYSGQGLRRNQHHQKHSR